MVAKHKLSKWDLENIRNIDLVVKSWYDLFTEIAKHNRKVAINCHGRKAAIEFMKTLNPGDKFWNSTVKYYVVQNHAVYCGSHWQISVVNQNQKKLYITDSYIADRRLYNAQPRSFTKEKQ